jgi:hypothetical protein
MGDRPDVGEDVSPVIFTSGIMKAFLIMAIRLPNVCMIALISPDVPEL